MEGGHLSLGLRCLRRRQLRARGLGRSFPARAAASSAVRRNDDTNDPATPPITKAIPARNPTCEAPGGDLRAGVLLERLPCEEHGRAEQPAAQSPPRRALERDQVPDHPHRVRGAARDDPHQPRQDDGVEHERRDPDRTQLRRIEPPADRVRDREVADREAEDEGNREREREPRVVAPVADRESHLDRAEGGDEPSQVRELALQAQRVRRSFGLHPTLAPLHGRPSPARYTRPVVAGHGDTPFVCSTP